MKTPCVSLATVTRSCLCFFPQCSLHIHAAYSTSQKLNVPMLPLSEPNAVGLILAHGNSHITTWIPSLNQRVVLGLSTLVCVSSGSVGDAISVMRPDVYVSDDGGYTWMKALEGPHHYAILDSGGLLVAVEHSPNEPIKKVKWVTLKGGRGLGSL